jgi:hypothetical protein
VCCVYIVREYFARDGKAEWSCYAEDEDLFHGGRRNGIYLFMGFQVDIQQFIASWRGGKEVLDMLRLMGCHYSDRTMVIGSSGFSKQDC